MRLPSAGAGETTVIIAHRGWEQLGAAGPDLRERNRMGWAGLISNYQRAYRDPRRVIDS